MERDARSPSSFQACSCRCAHRRFSVKTSTLPTRPRRARHCLDDRTGGRCGGAPSANRSDLLPNGSAPSSQPSNSTRPPQWPVTASRWARRFYWKTNSEREGSRRLYRLPLLVHIPGRAHAQSQDWRLSRLGRRHRRAELAPCSALSRQPSARQNTCE
jgi:hypothetical protein